MTSRRFEPGAGPEPSEATQSEAAPPGPLRRVVLLVAYDGTAFHGFAAQGDPEIATLGGLLGSALATATGAEVKLVCAGRTDRGVHASGQVVHADLPIGSLTRFRVGRDGDLPTLAASLTSQCGGAIVVRRALLAPADFDARRSALSRRYRYELWRRESAEPLVRHMAWHVPGELDLRAMQTAADALLGSHDFSAFCRRPPGLDGPLTRHVLETGFDLSGRPDRLGFEIEARAFCHQMVRSIVGDLVAVGQGKMTAADVVALLRSGDRTGSVRPAPPEGLRLVLVRYPPDLVEHGVFGDMAMPAPEPREAPG